MPSFNQQQLNYKVANSNAVLVMMGDIPVAFAQTSSQGIDFGTESLYGIGSAKPQEIQQLKFSPTISIDSFVLTNQGVVALSYPTTLVSILANNSFSINLMSSDGLPLLVFVGCVAVNYNQNVPTNSIISETLTFNAMDVLDNTGQSILNSNSIQTALATLAAAGIGLNTLGL